jgi:hypothetical protein
VEYDDKADSVDPADKAVKSLADGLLMYGISVATKVASFKEMFQRESDD